MSFRLRLTLLYAFALAVTLLAAGAVAWWQTGEQLRGAFAATLEARAAGVATALENNGQTGIQETDVPSGGVFVAILDAQGAILDATSNLPAGLPLTDGGVSFGGQSYLLHRMPLPDGTAVVTGGSTAPLENARSELTQALLVSGGLAAALSLAAGFVIARRALRPVDRMTAEAAQVGSRDLEWRVEEPATQDELGRLARTLNAMLDRVYSSVAQQRAFVAEASHDLRTPLAALRAELELADRPDADVDELRAALRAAQADTTQLVQVADALLHRAMDPHARPDTLRRSTPIQEMVQASVLRVSLPARSRGVRVLSTVADGIVAVDRLRIEQAIANLLQNAVAHGPKGSTVELNSRTLADESGKSWLVEVLDRGPGLRTHSPEELFGAGAAPKVGALRRGRRGFGLGSVRAAVEAHGGRFGAENRPGGGARFWFSVPV